MALPRIALTLLLALAASSLLVCSSGTASGTPSAATPQAEPTIATTRAAQAAPAAAPIQGVDSMWVWKERPAAELAAITQTLAVRRVFLFVGNPSPEGDRNIRRTVRLLQADDVEVYALSGEPTWTFKHRPALAWAHRALALAPFNGLHLDVEPHALKNWKRDQQALVADYLRLMDKVAQLRGPLEVDVQFAYGKVVTPGGSTFADDILSRVDAVTVMSYRDSAKGPNGMLAIAEDWLQRASVAGKSVWLAAETNAYPDCIYCTFYEEGQAGMADVLSEVDTTVRADERFTTYQGISIEDLDGWLALS